MDLIRNYSYYMIWNKVFVFIVLSCVLHAGFFSLFYFYNGNLKDSYAEESMMVRIVGTLVSDDVILKKGVSRGVSNHNQPNIVSGIISSGNVIQSCEKKNEVILRQAQDENIPPPLNPLPQGEGRLDEQLREEGTGYIPSPLPPEGATFVPSPLTGEGQGGGDLRGFSNEGSYGDAGLIESEPSLRLEKELRSIVLTKIRKNMEYPFAARKLGLEGDVKISFRISPDGTVKNVLAGGKDTDLTLLEQAAISLINNSAPFNIPMSHNIKEAVSIKMVISYRLEDIKR